MSPKMLKLKQHIITLKFKTYNVVPRTNITKEIEIRNQFGTLTI